MKITDNHKRHTKIMKILEIDAIITKIMKMLQNPYENCEKQEN